MGLEEVAQETRAAEAVLLESRAAVKIAVRRGKSLGIGRLGYYPGSIAWLYQRRQTTVCIMIARKGRFPKPTCEIARHDRIRF